MLRPLHFTLLLLAAFALVCGAARADCVVLLHGLARGPASMAMMGAVLEGRGHVVINADYPSTKAPPEALLPYISAAFARCPPGLPRQAVAHSLGGILLRAWHAGAPEAPLKGAVLLGPPSQGSELVDKLGGLKAFSWTFGPSGRALGTGADALPQSLPPPDFPLGIIAGRQSLNPLASALIPGPDDGKVALERTKVVGATWLALPVTHTFMMMDPVVIAETAYFLEQGRFDPDMNLKGAFAYLRRAPE